MQKNGRRDCAQRRTLYATASILAVFLACSAAAAQVPAPPKPAATTLASDPLVSEVVVTGSRISASGFTQPTPVTMLSGEQLEQNAPGGTLSEALAPLPELRLSTNPQGGQTSSNNMGAITQLNLRGLSVNRTLVLMDGQRLAPANTGNAPDLNVLPQMLIKRVDVVTGGASAAYGSDAVAGVVNFILDDGFRGLRVDVDGGLTERGDGANEKVGVAFGTDVLGGRLHLLGSAEFYNTEGIFPDSGRAWSQQGYLPLTNPAVNAANPASPTNPTFIIAPNARIASGTAGGLITSGPFANTQFVNGQPTPFSPGTLHTTGFQQGGDGVDASNVAALALPLRRNAEFLRAEYEITSHVRAFASFSYGEERSTSTTQVPSQAFTIFSGNPFIPAGIQSQMTAGNIASFPLGKFNIDVGGSKLSDSGNNHEVVLGLKGDFEVGSRSFTWDFSYENGQSSYSRRLLNAVNQVSVYNAADSVVVTAANRGASGLAVGSTVCRTSLTLPSNGCVPINPFIPLSQDSQTAQNYIFFREQFRQTMDQQSAQANISGKLFDDWAGPVLVAAGVEWRRNSDDVISDTGSQTRPAAYVAATAPGLRGLPASANSANPGLSQFGNFQPYRGAIEVNEGYLEVSAPLARNMPLIHAADLNAAYRHTEYSTSGGVDTWKAGLTWDITPDLRLRGTRSRDIRAPDIVELDSPARQQGTTVTDPFNGNASVTTIRFDSGNPALRPEKGDTTTAGIVYRPSWLPGFNASLDGYDIRVKDAIVLLVAQDVVSGCQAGSPQYCALVTRANNAPNGTILSVATQYFNGQQIHETGIDVESSYTTPVDRFVANWSGRLTLRALVNYVGEYTLTQRAGLPTIDFAGQIGSTGSGSSGIYGIPHWGATFSASYTNGPFSLYAQERFVDGGKYNNAFNTSAFNAPGQSITYINDNDVSGRAYTDLNVRYTFGKGRYELVASIQNLFDRDPPIVPSAASTLPTETNGLLYDTLGRRFNFGLHVKL